MIQLSQRTRASHVASVVTLPFPSVEQIRRVADHPTSEESVLQRLRAPFSYLPLQERAVLGEAARVASRCERAWVFTEPEVARTKQVLGVVRGGAQGLSVRLVDFHREYTTQLAESCVLQRHIAETLWHKDARTGQLTYVVSVEDALRRPNRDSLLRAAIHLFLETFVHEQRRFAFGSSLKELVHRALANYPTELHQLLLTSTRGDFWSRYDRDLIGYAEAPTADERERLLALYFDGDDDRLDREMQRVRALPSEVVADRQRRQSEQDRRLASARIRKGYVRLGDLPAQRARTTSDIKADVAHIDQLLWVDNVLEKYIDHKHLLHHEMFLRLHMIRLAVAALIARRDVDVRHVTARVVADAVADLLGRGALTAPSESETRRADLTQLATWFGEEAAAFACPSTELAARMLALLSEQRHIRTSNVPRAVVRDGAEHVAAAA